MELVGQMYKLSACFDTPNEYKGLPYDYFPDDAVSYGSTICSFGLPYNDHNYGMPTGLTPPVMAPHLMDPVTKPKKFMNDFLAKTKIEPTSESDMIGQSMTNSPFSTDFADPTVSLTPRKQYLDENDYPVYVEPEIKVVEVPDKLCVSASEYSDCSSESSDDTKVNPDFLIYLRTLPNRHISVDRYLNKARRHYEAYAHSQKSSGSEKRECSLSSDVVIDCICEYSYDDKRMVQCESCGIKQHLDCMYVNPRLVQNFLKHRCQKCSDIKVDVSRAKAIQNSRKNWHLTNQLTDKAPHKGKTKTDDKKNKDVLMKLREAKNESTVNDGTASSSKNTGNVTRVNKRKQDLKVYGEQEPVCAPAKSIGTEDDEDGLPAAQKSQAQQSASDAPPLNESQELPEVDLKPDLSVPSTEYSEEMAGGKAPDGSSDFEYAERLAIINRRNQPFKKDYKEATKSLYTSALLSKIADLKESEEEKQNILANANVEGLEQGTEFLDRNPRCRIVLFDGCTMGLEASVRLQNCSIVAAMIGRMMLMEEYLKYASPTSEYRPFVFLYHGFGDHGLVIDTTVYGNIARYLRRSCDPNVKLEHTILGGSLYVVIRTTTEICQGVELTIPFDLPFEICQYPVQCACGKVRCPAIKHRRKHHRNRIITSNINCEQVIEDKLRELSQPLCSSTSTYTANVTGLKKPIIGHRYSMQSRPHLSDSFNASGDPIDAKPSFLLSGSTNPANDSDHNSSIITEDRIKREEKEPSLEPADLFPPSSPAKPLNSDLSGTGVILTTKRRPKPVLHPDFEVDLGTVRAQSDKSRNRSAAFSCNQQSTTPVKPKTEPSVNLKRNNSNSEALKSPQKSTIKEVAGANAFKSIITTRQQKLNKTPPLSSKRARPTKIEPVEDEAPPKRSTRTKK